MVDGAALAFTTRDQIAQCLSVGRGHMKNRNVVAFRHRELRLAEYAEREHVA